MLPGGQEEPISDVGVLPTSLAAALDRVSAAPAPVRRLLDVLAAAGHPVPATVLARLPSLADLDLAAALVDAERARLVSVGTDGSYSVETFASDAIRHGATFIEVARIRGELGRALADAGVAPTIAVHHRMAGLAAAPDASAIPWANDATFDAIERGDLDEAAELAEATLTAIRMGAPSSLTDRLSALSNLAYACTWSGRHDEGERAMREADVAARRSGDRALQGAVVASSFRANSIAVGDDRDEWAFIDDVLDELGDDGPPALRSHLLSRRSSLALFADQDLARRSADEALALARTSGDSGAIVVAAYERRLAMWHPTRQAEALALADEMGRVGARAGVYGEYATFTRIQVALESGDAERFQHGLNSLSRRILSHRRPVDRIWYHAGAGAAALRAGRWTEAADHAAQALEICEPARYEAAQQYLLAQQLIAAWQQGDDLRGLLDDAFMPPGPLGWSWHACVLGLVADRLEPGEVERSIAAHLGHDGEGVRDDLTWGPVTGCLAMAAAEVGARDAARLLAPMLRPVDDQWAASGGATCFGPLALHRGRLLALLGRVDEAAILLQRGLADAARWHAAPWIVRYHLALAELGDADDHLAHARTGAERLGMRSVLEVVEGRQAARAQPTYPDRLSEREAHALALVAAGCSNKEIAERLFLSVKTVERHLASGYAKAGVRRRAEAAAYAIHHHLPVPTG